MIHKTSQSETLEWNILLIVKIITHLIDVTDVYVFPGLVITVFLGIHQQALLLPAPWSTGLLGFIVVWFVLADLVLEVHRRGFLPIGQWRYVLGTQMLYTCSQNNWFSMALIFAGNKLLGRNPLNCQIVFWTTVH